MSAPITDRAAIVLQQIDAELALAEKATQGPWTTGYIMESESRVYDCDTNRLLDAHGRASSANATFIATSRTFLPASLRCLKTAIGSLKAIYIAASNEADSEFAAKALTALCDQWSAAQ
jgi:hypothetical protein